MRRIALFATVTALLATAATGSAGAVYPDTIALPNGWLPEGIAIAPGGTFYSGSRANGAVYGGSLRTGEGAIVVPGAGRPRRRRRGLRPRTALRRRRRDGRRLRLRRGDR